MPCEILKLCDYCTWHREGESCVTVGAQFWEGRLQVTLCHQKGAKHFPHLDLNGAESLTVLEKVSLALREFA